MPPRKKSIGLAALFFLLQQAGLAAAQPDRRALILERAGKLAGFTGQDVPAAGKEILAQADAIAGGTLFFYEKTPVRVNLKDIDWSGSHIKHQEWPAQLNRFFHLQPLAAAYRATHKEKYAQAARAYIEDWLRADPYPDAPSMRKGDNTLTMSIRLGTSVHGGWGAALPAFLGSPAFDDAFLDRVMASIAGQAEYLSHHLTTSGNWRISQLDALTFTALRFPFLPNAERLKEVGTTGMRNALATQFSPDGVHVERTPDYADWMAQVLANYLQVQRLFPQMDVAVKPDLLVRALDYQAHSELFGVNDSPVLLRDPVRLTGLATRSATLRRLRIEAPQPSLAQVFPNAGHVFVRTGWKPGDDYLAFDAGSWGGAHSHLSRLELVFRSRGRLLVADPGILTYEMTDPLGPYGKSTAAHSTLNIGGGNQSAADAQLLHTAFTDDVALVHGRYEGGYWEGKYEWSFPERGRGSYGKHERVVFWVKGEYMLIIDSMAADPRAEIHNVWQMGPMEKWAQDAAKLAWWSVNRDTNVRLQMLAAPPATTMQTFEGSRAPLRGWVGNHGNDALAAPLVEFRYPASDGGGARSVVLLTAYSGNAIPTIAVKALQDAAGGSLHHVDLGLAGGVTDRIAWSNGLQLPIDDADPFTTDAGFVWVRTNKDGSVRKQFLLQGSYLK